MTESRLSRCVAVLLGAAVVLGCTRTAFPPDSAIAALSLEQEGSVVSARSPIAYEHQLRGEVLAERGNVEMAIVAYTIALEADPGDFYLRTRLAELLIENGAYQKARRYVTGVLATDRTNEFAWLVMAKLHHAKGQYRRASAAAMRAMQAEPRRFEAAIWLANYYRMSGDSARAAEIFRRVIETDSGNGAARLGMVLLHHKRDDWPVALAHFESMCRLNPSHTAHMTELDDGSVPKNGSSEYKTDLFRLAVACDPHNLKLRDELVGELIRLGLIRSARQYVNEMARAKPRDRRLVPTTVRWLLETGQPYRARTALLNHFTTSPKDPSVQLTWFEIEIALCRLEMARKVFERFGQGWTAAQRQDAQTRLQTSCEEAISSPRPGRTP